MKLSEELIWRGFTAETTIKDPTILDTMENKTFYWGADPSADSLTIGNLAALMMCACFVRHGYKPYLLVGGATGQIGDPKETRERDLKSLEEVEHNKKCIKEQIKRVISSDDVVMVDNYDWFKNINYIDFLRNIGKQFSMTQLLDRKFIQSRIGEGGSGISYAEFSYTLIQGYDFYHLYKKYGIQLQLCGADQYGNCSSGISLIRKLENAEANVWSTPLIIDPVTGRKFGKSEGNAVWLASSDNGQGNFTTVFDFYQFWLNQADSAVEYLLKIYTIYSKEEIEKILAEHKEHPEERIAQKALARGATEVVHGKELTEAVIRLTEKLFAKETSYSDKDIDDAAKILPVRPLSTTLVEDLVCTGLASSKKEARQFIKAGAVSANGVKITDENKVMNAPAILKRGKNKFAVVR
ncbi:tyrosine--tRNA ligase [Candidatus Saccharibacteria bacterium]|nr:tyrosine--tRNA ligase [Candidatus Saccharibacteria bacterium]